MNILLIWQQIPESCKFYLLPAVSNEETERIKVLNDKFANEAKNTPEEDKELEWLSTFLVDKEELNLPVKIIANEIIVVTSGFFS